MVINIDLISELNKDLIKKYNLKNIKYKNLPNIIETQLNINKKYLEKFLIEIGYEKYIIKKFGSEKINYIFGN